MARFIYLILTLLLIPSFASAQLRPVVEIGTNVGATLTHSTFGTQASIGIPGEGILGQPTLYASFFTGNVVIEPQVGLSVLIYDGGSAEAISFGAQAGYLFSGSQASSPFVAASAASQTFIEGPAETEFGLGAKVGYRFLVGESLGLRIEGGYRRWFSDPGLNEVMLGVGIGAVVNRIP